MIVYQRSDRMLVSLRRDSTTGGVSVPASISDETSAFAESTPRARFNGSIVLAVWDRVDGSGCSGCSPFRAAPRMRALSAAGVPRSPVVALSDGGTLPPQIESAGASFFVTHGDGAMRRLAHVNSEGLLLKTVERAGAGALYVRQGRPSIVSVVPKDEATSVLEVEEWDASLHRLSRTHAGPLQWFLPAPRLTLLRSLEGDRGFFVEQKDGRGNLRQFSGSVSVSPGRIRGIR